jgi:sensor histidine kinase YesM
VGSLSQFLRMTLDMSSENEVPLRKELDFVARYLEIQQVRFGDRLRVRREIDLQNMNALVPPLILQPLVENAIRYGIESRETGGTVTIRAARDGDVLKMEVADDGEGFKEIQLRSERTGIGLSNTRHRLQELYGDKHQFRLTSNHPTGACVKLEIPFSLGPAESWSAA